MVGTRGEDFSRQQLLDLVWTTPMQRLSKRYAFSDRGLAKLCDRFGVPVPPQGYWAVPESRRPARRLRLRPLPAGQSEPIVTLALREPDPVKEDPRLVAQKLFESLPENRIQCASPNRYHRLVSRTRSLRSEPRVTLDSTGISSFAHRGGLDIRVSKALLDRALKLANALIVSAEARGMMVDCRPAGTNGGAVTAVTVFGHSIAFRIQERLKNVPANPKDPWPRVTQAPSGRLFIQIDEWAEGVRKLWQDGDGKRLEDCLNDVMVSLTAVAIAKEIQEKENAERHAEFLKAQRLAEEAAERRRLEETRVKAVEGQESLWRWAGRIEAFSAAARAYALSADIGEEKRTELLSWYEWIDSKAKILKERAFFQGAPVK